MPDNPPAIGMRVVPLLKPLRMQGVRCHKECPRADHSISFRKRAGRRKARDPSVHLVSTEVPMAGSKRHLRSPPYPSGVLSDASEIMHE